jgi:RimJ/RimL family protein N-acetyltransferase
MTTVSTERLLLRPLEWADREAYAAFRFHPAVAASEATIARFQSGWSTHGYAPWGVFCDGRLIGQCGLNFVPEFEATEVLWALHPNAWGKGYATEAARAALELGFETIGLVLIFAITRPENFASQAVMKRLGLVYRRDVVYRDIASVWFDISRPS